MWPDLSRKILVSIIVVCLFDASVELVGVAGELNRYKAQRTVADYLRDHFQPNEGTRIFCDEGTVRTLSGIAPERFLTSSDAPRDREGFLTFLKAQNVAWVVVVKKQDSTPSKEFPSSTSGEPIEGYQRTTASYSSFLPMNIQIYRRKEVSD